MTRTSAALIAMLSIFAAIPDAGYCVKMRFFEKESGAVFGGVRDLAGFGGKLYIGSKSQGIFVFDPGSGTFAEFWRNADLPSRKIVSLATRGDVLYIGTAEGLAVYDGSAVQIVEKIQNVTMKATVLGADPFRGEIFAASVYLAGGLVRTDGTGWRFIGGQGKGLFNNVTCFAFTREKVFFGSMHGALFEYDGKNIEGATDDFFPANLSSLGVLDGTVYVGTNKGLFRVQDRKWQKVPLPGRFDSASINSIRAAGGELLLGTAEGLVGLSSGRVRTLSAREGFPGKNVFAAYRLDDRVYAGTREGLVEITEW